MSECGEKKGYEKKAEVESHDNKFHPTGGEMLGENLENTCVCTPHVQPRQHCCSHPPFCLNFELAF